MKKIISIISIVLLTVILFSSCSASNSKAVAQGNQNKIESKTGANMVQTDNQQKVQSNAINNNAANTKDSLIQEYKGQTPHQWGEKIAGVKTHINTNEKIIALTFDACGGKNGDGYDSKLINYLIKENVPATLFIGSRWIDANYSTFTALYNNPLFEIENHGSLHKPLSVDGKSAYGIKGTADVGQVVDEVQLNELKIEKITGRRPRYFRSGTDYYDEIAVKIANDLGQKIISYSVLGDAGATFNTAQVKKACLSTKPGSIIILHMNHPEKYTAEGIIEAVPQLKKMGYKFVKLEDYDNYLE